METEIAKDVALIFTIDIEGRYLSFNKAYSDWLQSTYQEQPNLGSAWAGLTKNRLLEHFQKEMLDAMRQGEAGGLATSKWQKLLGKEVLAIEAMPLVVDDHKMGLTVSIRVQESTYNKEKLFHLAYDLFSISNFDNYLLELNEQWVKVLGYSKEELKSRRFLEFLHPEDLERTREEADRLYSGKPETQNFRNRYRTKTGEYVWLEWNSIIDSEQQLLYSVARDITSQEILNQQLRESEERYRSVVEAVHEGIVVHDLQDKIMMCNQSAAKILGLSVDQLMGRDSFDPRWKALTVDQRPLDPADHPSMVTSRTGLPVTDFLMNVHIGDERRKIIAINSNPIINDRGQMYGVVASFLDVTTEQTALENLEKTLEIKTLLFRELHHRIKNNLNLISNLMYLKSEAAEDPSLKHFVSETNSRILSIAKIHEQLLELEEANQLYTQSYLNDLVKTLIRTCAADQGQYDVSFDVENHKLDVDRILMVGLITNEILSNTLKYAYGDNGGKIIVRLWKEGDTIHYILADEGQGIALSDEPPKSIGMDLIDMFGKQLKGTIIKDFENGVKYHITFPVDTSRQGL